MTKANDIYWGSLETLKGKNVTFSGVYAHGPDDALNEVRKRFAPEGYTLLHLEKQGTIYRELSGARVGATITRKMDDGSWLPGMEQ